MKLFFISILSVVSLGCSEIKSVYILPRDFVGYILVIYNQGENSSAQMDSKTLKVPKDGIVKLNKANNSDWEEIPEFYYETIKNNQKLPFVSDMNNFPMDKVVVSGGALVKSYSNTNSKQYVEYRVYYVGNDKQIEEFYRKVESLDFESLSKL